MSFFVQFLVFELLSFLYFKLFYSDLGLGRWTRKQRSLDLQNILLTLTCSKSGVNPKTYGDWGQRPRWGVRGASSISAKFRKNKNKLITSQKLRMAQKKAIRTKNEHQININLS